MIATGEKDLDKNQTNRRNSQFKISELRAFHYKNLKIKKIRAQVVQDQYNSLHLQTFFEKPVNNT